jgi:hypothetical protein
MARGAGWKLATFSKNAISIAAWATAEEYREYRDETLD